MPRLSKIGAAALAAFGWTAGASVTADFLVVGGGGGGGSIYGGGGAGGFRTSAGTSGGGASAEGKLSLNPTQSYTVTVGAGGNGGAAGGNNNGAQGSSSSFSTITSTGGGFGSAQFGGSNGGSGGSGGGAGVAGGTAGAGTANQGYNGGSSPAWNSQSGAGAAGGGGAGAVGGNGANGPNANGGSGGAGVSSSISGSSVTYAGGGGGGTAQSSGTSGSGGSGGGGNAGATGGNNSGVSGTANTGGGGGGGNYNGSFTQIGGNGGSGIVIISYAGAQQFGGGVVTSVGGNTIHTFTTSGTLSPLSSLTANFLVVAGGGGGGASYGGGGGAGGLRSSVTNTGGGGSLESALTIDTNSIYLVTVGAGGAGAVYTGSAAVSGSNSAFLSVTSTGGGRSGQFQIAGASGGSGGGGGAASGTGAAGGSGTANQGFAGGTGAGYNGVNGYAGGGGGGAGAVGQSRTALQNTGGAGGAGVTVAITGSSVGYAGGGGGSGYLASGGTATDGGGAGANYNVVGSNGTANTGGGGGGGGDTGAGSGNGGSGIVIISYPGSTPQMAGGTVTAAGGNIIHTFTSSGYLTPITNLNNSLRFRSSASAYLNRTPTSAGNRKTWTFSTWVKLGEIAASNGTIFAAGTTSGVSTRFYLRYTGSQFQTGYGSFNLDTTVAVYRDPSAWYHVVLAIDTTQATAANRLKIYVNGVQQTVTTSVNYSQNDDTAVNNSVTHSIARDHIIPGGYFDGYLTDTYLIDGQALTPNSFGAFNGQGVWQPVRYGGSYGTNGFYLPFTNTTSTTTLGYDFSPNGNNWTTNNISLTAGSTYDSMRDVPTNTSATVANYCVFNPLDRGSTNFTFSNGNLTVSGASASSSARATMAVSSGKWYWEATPTAIGNGLGVGFAGDSSRFNPVTWNAGTYVIYQSDGNKHINGSASSYGATYTTNDVIGVALDMDAGTITFYKNNVSQGTASTGLTGVYLPVFSQTSGATTGTINANFGAGSGFTYTPPAGFVALNTFNLPTPTIGATPATTANKYMNVLTYTGNSATSSAGTVARTLTGLGFQPDLTWVKSRNNGGTWNNHSLTDSVRGNNLSLSTNSTDAEINVTTAFGAGGVGGGSSDGFTLVSGSSGNTTNLNSSSGTYVGWCWKANGSGSTNTAGSITSTVSANTTAGFSIVTWTGNGASSATIGHGLGVAPSMIIVKNRSATWGWFVYNKFLTNPNTGRLQLNLTNGEIAGGTPGPWNNTAPTSTVFSLGDSTFPEVNGSGNSIVAYCFAQVAGYSAFGSYTGNGSTDGPFVFTGFRPKFVMFKRTDSSGSWHIFDSSINTYNAATQNLYPNGTNTETANNTQDLLSNGFKCRSTDTDTNANGGTYIYAAFAESPFKYANAR